MTSTRRLLGALGCRWGACGHTARRPPGPIPYSRHAVPCPHAGPFAGDPANGTGSAHWRQDIPYRDLAPCSLHPRPVLPLLHGDRRRRPATERLAAMCLSHTRTTRTHQENTARCASLPHRFWAPGSGESGRRRQSDSGEGEQRLACLPRHGQIAVACGSHRFWVPGSGEGRQQIACLPLHPPALLEVESLSLSVCFLAPGNRPSASDRQ